jgi:hypothetical protein
MKKKMTTKGKLRLAQAAGIATSFAPLAIAVGVDYETYFASKAAGWSLTIGGGLAVALAILSALGKAGKLFNSGTKIAAFIFVFSMLLSPVVLNLQFLSGMLLAGEATNSMVVQPKVAKLKRRLEKEDLTDTIRRANHARNV